MILVDTSVWIRFFMRNPAALPLEALLRRQQVAGHELVYGELLIGDRGGRSAFLSEYERLPYATNALHFEVVSLVHARRLHGRGVGWIDIHLLASALVNGMRLWTVDPRLAVIAREFDIYWDGSHSVN